MYVYTVSEKSVFPTSFGRGRFQGNLFSCMNIIILDHHLQSIIKSRKD